MAEQQEKRTVRVVLGRREGGYPGMWAAKKFWPVGETQAELTEEEIANVAARPEMVVLDDGGRRLLSQDIANPTGLSEQLTKDEAAALADYRRAKAKDPDLADKFNRKYRADKEAFEPSDSMLTSAESSLRSDTPSRLETQSQDAAASTEKSSKDTQPHKGTHKK